MATGAPVLCRLDPARPICLRSVARGQNGYLASYNYGVMPSQVQARMRQSRAALVCILLPQQLFRPAAATAAAITTATPTATGFPGPPHPHLQPISFCEEVPATARVHVYLASVMVLVSCEDVCMLSVRRLYPCLFLKLRCLISCLQPPVLQFLVVCATGSRSSEARSLVSMGNQEREKGMTTRDKTRG